MKRERENGRRGTSGGEGERKESERQKRSR